MAPEILFSVDNSPYTSKCDLYSIGVVYYFMLFGELPFPAKSVKELGLMIEKFSGQNLVIPKIPPVSNESKQLLRSLLDKDPIERLSWR